VETAVYFISDLHLGLQDKEAEEKKELKLIEFLILLTIREILYLF
jgi:UDP-2,3-diacylglucosamine pyrophosphatase LpxH